MALPKITPADTGTWLEGCHGWNNTWRVIDIALDHGWMNHGPEVQAHIREDVQRYIECNGCPDVDDYLFESIHELATDATEFLQSIAPEGYVFEWDAGELCLLAVDESEEWAYV
jgi:hypothetical protein